MAETTALPLQPAPVATVAAAPANAPANAARPAAALAADAGGTESPTDPAHLFDFLLGDVPDSAAALDSALPGLARTAAARRPDDESTSADPLQMILAQMPAPASPVVAQAIPAARSGLPDATLPTSALPAAISVASPAGMQVPAPALDAGTDSPGVLAFASAAQALPQAASGTPQVATPEGHVAPFTRSVGPGADLSFPMPALASGQSASPLAWPAGDTAAFAQSGGDPSAATSVAPLHAMQALGAAAQVPAATAFQAGPMQVPVLQQPQDPSQGYDEPFGQHVAWLAGQRIGQAEIRVVPEHLGAIDIRLQMDGNNVRAEFHSSQPEVRQALEASFPRLRDMLGQQGLQLSHAGVGQGQSGQRQAGDGAPRPGQGQGDELSLPHEAGSPLPPDFRRGRGLVDVYA